MKVAQFFNRKLIAEDSERYVSDKEEKLKVCRQAACIGIYVNKNKKKWVPLRAMKTFIRKKMGHIT